MSLWYEREESVDGKRDLVGLREGDGEEERRSNDRQSEQRVVAKTESSHSAIWSCLSRCI